jgi:hypothetical protein
LRLGAPAEIADFITAALGLNLPRGMGE